MFAWTEKLERFAPWSLFEIAAALALIFVFLINL
jgi:hypothetical protein